VAEQEAVLGQEAEAVMVAVPAGAPQVLLAAAGVEQEQGQEAVLELEPEAVPAGWGVSAPVPVPRSALALMRPPAPAPMRRLGPVRTLRSALAPTRRQPLEPIPVQGQEKARLSVTVRAMAPETWG
jgi:hypothetical protein